MIEILLALQPIAEVFFTITIIMFTLAIIVLVILIIIERVMTLYEDIGSDQDLKEVRITTKIITKISAISIILFLLITPAAKAWDIYKNVLIYRAINSDTSAQVVKNTNLLLEKLEEVIEEVDAKKLIQEVQGTAKEEVIEELKEK